MLVADSFDFPLGTAAERRGMAVPTPRVRISNPYLNYYFLDKAHLSPAYHTGIDCSFPEERDGGKGETIYACANGVITFAQRITEQAHPHFSAWGNLIIQRCLLGDGRTLYIRYAHASPLLVRAGDTVLRGQAIADESDAFGRYAPHLHLDFSLTNILATIPWDWPGIDYHRIQIDYIDPHVFIKRNRPMGTSLEQIKVLAQSILDVIAADVPPATPPVVPPPVVPPPAGSKQGRIKADGVHIRQQPSTSAVIVGSVNTGTVLDFDPGGVTADNYHWLKIVTPGVWAGAWIADAFVSF